MDSDHSKALQGFARTRSWDEVQAHLDTASSDPADVGDVQGKRVGAQLELVLSKAKALDQGSPSDATDEFLLEKGVLQTMLGMSPGTQVLDSTFLMPMVGELSVEFDGPKTQVKVDGNPWGFTGETHPTAAKFVTVRLVLTTGTYRPEPLSIAVPPGALATAQFEKT